MRKTQTNIIKLQIKGKATPAPPIGPALGQKGVNIQSFCKQYNERTSDRDPNAIMPVVITINPDKSFHFVVKEPPVSSLILQKLRIKKGSSTPGRATISSIQEKIIREIAAIKMSDIGISDIEKAIKIVSGTARSMGIEIIK
jgi:large subunit ribosomal protein L11